MATTDFAAFTATLELTNVPDAVVRRARWALLDTVAVAVAGARTPAGRVAVSFADGQQGTSRLLGALSTATSSPERAAFAGGVCASVLDFDDGHYLGGGIHPGAPVIAALVAAAAEETTVAELLVATLTGYETAIPAGARLAPTSPDGDVHTSGTAGAMGAAAAVGRLRRLDADCVGRALRIADAHAPRAPLTTTMAKESIGWAAATGLVAAELARAGFDESVAAVSTAATPRGFDTQVLDRPELLSQLPNHSDGAWETSAVYVKPYACCRVIHAALDALAAALASTGTAAIDDIQRIDVGVGRSMTGLDLADPPTLELAQFSYPHALATRLVRGALGPDELDETSLSDPTIRSLAHRVVVRHAAELDAPAAHNYPATVSVRTRQGTATILAEHALGSVAAPLSDDQVHAKFLRSTTPTLGAERANEIAALLLDPSADATPVFTLLGGGASHQDARPRR